MAHSHAPSDGGRRPLGTAALVIWAVIAIVALLGFLYLGTWQVERRAWKLDLIERVQARIHADAQPAPARAQWPALQAAPGDYEYRRVQVRGAYLHAQTALVQATSVLDSGYWVMTPLQTEHDGIVLVNRGFVPRAQPDGPWRASQAPQGQVTVTGLLRLPEPDGAFLRSNDAAADRWFSRDIAAIAAARGQQDVAPYFIDAEASAPLPQALTLEPPARLPDDMLPVPGLTVVSFNNNHLTYALTWYGLALMVAAGAWYLLREERRLRRQRNGLTLRSHEACDDPSSPGRSG